MHCHFSNLWVTFWENTVQTKIWQKRFASARNQGSLYSEGTNEYRHLPQVSQFRVPTLRAAENFAWPETFFKWSKACRTWNERFDVISISQREFEICCCFIASWHRGPSNATEYRRRRRAHHPPVSLTWRIMDNTKE